MATRIILSGVPKELWVQEQPEAVHDALRSGPARLTEQATSGVVIVYPGAVAYLGEAPD